jgi:hypothetical protein
MEHTQIVNASDLATYADTRDSEAVIPELVWMLVNQVPDLTVCRIPYGDAVNQPGLDGLVKTVNGFRQFVPKDRSFGEIGTGSKPHAKATADFAKRTKEIPAEERAECSYVFVTPYGAGSGGWNEPAQRRWLNRRKQAGWRDIHILDAVQLADWLREFPAIGKWLLKKMTLVKSAAGFSTPTEHWENLEKPGGPGEPPLPAKIFLIGREQACAELERLFAMEKKQLLLRIESELDAEDLVAAYIASLPVEQRRAFANKCLFVSDPDAWLSFANLRTAHVLVAHPKLDLEVSGEQLHLAASRRGHAVVIPLSGSSSGSTEIITLRSPSSSLLESALTEAGYKPDRARQLAEAGALSLASLKRHLRGLGDLPPYTTWDAARLLAQAELIGRWSGENPADKAAVETIVGKSYGEWIEAARPVTLRPDTPLTQHNEDWKIISRGEAWTALGPRLANDDLDRFKTAALAVLSESDPKLELPPDERFAAGLRGKVLKHSSSLRKGLSETLALLGSRPKALSSCSTGRPELVAIMTVRELLEGAGWVRWASMDSHLPMLAEAAPDEFLDAVEAALVEPTESVFRQVFAQERSGFSGTNHMTGLLWALETLAWHSNHLLRVTMILGDLAGIDPGGNWSNRPANSLIDIFLPWHPQTCAPIPKRISAVAALVRDNPAIGWKLLMALLPNSHSITSGNRKPVWQDFIPADWNDSTTNRDYWEQVNAYAELAVTTAAADLSKLAELIDRLPDLPDRVHSRVLRHLVSTEVVSLHESDRLPIWEALVDLAAKHRKFSDADWAMSSAAVEAVEATAGELAPKSAELVFRRLFSERDFELLEERGDYEQQLESLASKREKAVDAVFSESGANGVLQFVKSVASPSQVGVAFGVVAPTVVDAELLPKYLRTDQVLAQFVSGFVAGRFCEKRWGWVDSLQLEKWNPRDAASLLSRLPFERETWKRAERLLGADGPAYWSQTQVNPYHSKEDIVEAAEKLLKHGRSRAAIQCLDRMVHEKRSVPTDLVVRALKTNLASEEHGHYFDQHACLHLIKLLQTSPDVDPNALFQIEWSYLPLLDRHLDAAPKTLEKKLATDPAFFCELIKAVFRSRNETEKPREPSEAEKKIAENGFRLLHEWRLPPGTNEDGSFDASALNSWVAAVKESSKASGHLPIALSQAGEALAHAPPDSDGLWIHSAVAIALNAKDAAEMRSGFTCELFNMRGVRKGDGVHDDRKLAALNHERADALEERGLSRIATAVRELAVNYERDAEREIARNAMAG